MQVIYIAPLKALVRERINDWTGGLCKRLGKRMVELTGEGRWGGGGGRGVGGVTLSGRFGRWGRGIWVHSLAAV